MRKLISIVAIGMVSAFALPALAEGLTEDIAFNIDNETNATITALYLSTPDDPNWGLDIAEDYIEAGETMEVSITDDLDECEYDMRVEFSDGDSLDYGSVDFCDLDGETVTISE